MKLELSCDVSEICTPLTGQNYFSDICLVEVLVDFRGWGDLFGKC